MPKEKIGFLISFMLAMLIFLLSFFLVYSNEILIDKHNKTKMQERIYYNKFYFSDYLQKFSDYKNSIVTNNKDSGNIVKWIIRLFGALGIGFAISIFSLQIFPEKDKNGLVKKSFLYSAIGVIFIIIFLNIYIFYLSGGFNIDFSWFYKKGQNGLSLIDKIFIIFIIVVIFLSLGMIYNNINKKDGD